ncbi:MAG: cytochrome c [Trueperaceae bacterium]|nr:cytochrome c [Trueperaceae bacterium]
MKASIGFSLLILLSLLLSSCGMNMYDQPKANLYAAAPYVKDKVVGTARPLPEGVVSRERGAVDPTFYTALTPEGLATDLPIPVTMEVLERGQERYNIYCSPCHNFNGNGLGMIVQKGMPQPASFHDPRLRASPVGYYYNAMTNGFGRMFSYASRIPPEDRWAIAAYIKALQLSQNASLSDVPESLRDSLEVQGASR